MRGIALIGSAFVVACSSGPAHATMWYVKGSVSQSGDGTSWETAVNALVHSPKACHFPRNYQADQAIGRPGAFLGQVRLVVVKEVVRCGTGTVRLGHHPVPE